MPKVSAIKQQVKRPGRYSIYLDGAYDFSLAEAELAGSGLAVGRELGTQELEELKSRGQAARAYERALDLVSRRPRSEWELKTYLKRKKYDAIIIQPTLDRLRERGYVDDMDFARRWVESRRLLKPTSRQRLGQELRKKRVAVDIIEQVLQDDETDEISVLRRLVERKRRQPKYQDARKLMQYLARQGFSYDDIKTVLNES